MGGRGSAGETGQRRRLSGGSACKRGGAYQRADALLAGSHASPQSSARTARGAGPMLVQADLRQFPAHSERHEKHAEHVVIEVAHAGCLRRRDAARPCEAAVPCISVICTTAARLRPCQKVRPWPHFWAARIYMKSVPCPKICSPDWTVRGSRSDFRGSSFSTPLFFSFDELSIACATLTTCTHHAPPCCWRSIFLSGSSSRSTSAG